MKKLFRPLALSAALLSFLASCHNDSPSPSPTPTGAGQYAFVINEGNFSNGIGSVSRFDKTSKDLVVDAFSAANGGAVLGSVVESMTVVDTKGYVVVNNSNKIEVVSLPDFKSTATIAGLNQPRFLVRSVANPSRAYVTEWLGGPYPAPYTAGRVSVIDLTTNKVVSTIPVGTNPEKPALVGGKLYVPNTGSNFLTVIDDATPTNTPTTIALPTPAGSVVGDKNSKLWILCGTDYVAQPATLVSFIPATSTQQAFPFPTVGSGSSLRISPDGTQLYYSYGKGEYRMNITDTALPTVPLIRRSFYGFDIDPATGTLYATDALNYSNPGRLIRYQPNGTKLDSATVQVSPNGVVFY
ncbi:MAG: DUF5074 domain-containing protein [Janthinobacterium lividum]